MWDDEKNLGTKMYLTVAWSWELKEQKRMAGEK